MATQPPSTGLPIFYGGLEPLSSSVHSGYRSKSSDRAPFLASNHAVPITIDEFVAVQRHFPIVFSIGENPVPLCLMGLNEGANVFVDGEGKVLGEVYMPAYVRRYPFMLARLQPDAQELSLCFDPSSDLVGEYKDGELLFDGDKPTEQLNTILKFCEDFEIAGQRTSAFVKELQDMDLLIDGEVSIQPAEAPQPFVNRGLRIVDEQKFRDLDTEQLHRISQNGILPLVTAHLFSLSLIRDIFGRQMAQGKVPTQAPAPVTADA